MSFIVHFILTLPKDKNKCTKGTGAEWLKGEAHNHMASPLASGGGNDKTLKEFQAAHSSCISLLLPLLPAHPHLNFLPGFVPLQGTNNILINVFCA